LEVILRSTYLDGPYVTEGTLSIHSISSQRRELFYWAAVLATFALGTGPASLVLAAAIAGFVYCLAKTGRDTPPDQDERSHEFAGRDVYMGDDRQAERSTA
jgi:hypothetical protein